MTYTLSVFDIYGTDKPKIPRGYEVVDFRPIADDGNEYYLNDTKEYYQKNFSVELTTNCLRWPDWDKIPLLILRKKVHKRRGS